VRVRRRVATLLDEVARVSGWLADRIDPPVDRSEPSTREESLQQQQARTRHPAYGERPQTLLGDVSPPDGPLAEVVPFPRPVDDDPSPGGPQ
jgi:hypothetical protein